MELYEEKKYVWTHDDIWSDLPLHITSAFVHHNYSIGMHTHTFYEVNIVFSGEGMHYIEKQCMPCVRGDVYVIPPQVRHGYGNTCSLDVFHILLHERFMSRFADELDAIDGYRLMFEIEPELRTRFDQSLFLHLEEQELTALQPFIDRLLELKKDKDKSSCVMRNSLVLFLITQLCSIYAGRRPQKERDDDPKTYHIMKSIEWMHANIADKITAEDMAAHAGVSRSTYFRLFGRMFGTAPGEYIMRCRLRRAEELLLNTDRTVLDIALSCGFFDSSHFIRNFSKYKGISPTQFRNRRRTTAPDK